MRIQPESLATSSLKNLASGPSICRILASAINFCDAREAVHRHVSRDGSLLLVDGQPYDLHRFTRIVVIGAGKAVCPMVAAANDLLDENISAGLAITKYGYLSAESLPSKNPVRIIEAGHPIPDFHNLEASWQLFSLIDSVDNGDLVICLLSGGGSSLLMHPLPGISLQDIKDLTSSLLSCGATISEINTIRKHLDGFKGGGLARKLSPATVISLIISDVVGNSLDLIASGPTAPDPSTYSDAWNILKQYKLLEVVPQAIKSHFVAGMDGKIAETLKPGDPIFANVNNVIVGTNSEAAEAAVIAARAEGYNSKLVSTSLQGEASHVGHSIASEATIPRKSPGSPSRPACLIYGGETTVTIRADGKGGRNQELALAAVKDLSGPEQKVLISLATDGGDGPTDAAGAVATNDTYQRGMSMNLDPDDFLARNDSYHYFEALGDLLKTGPTLTNLNDLVLLFIL